MMQSERIKSKMPEFDLMATFIVPYQFNAENNYRLSFENEIVARECIKDII